jgi:hypothetical protein
MLRFERPYVEFLCIKPSFVLKTREERLVYSEYFKRG